MTLEIKNVSFSYGKKEVIKDISFKASENELITLLGVNGSGKTTLLKAINHLLIPDGLIYINDTSIANYKIEELAKMISYVPQKLNFTKMTVFDTILLGRLPFIKWKEGEEDKKIVSNIICKLHLEKLAMQDVTTLSGGMQQITAIARALVTGAKIILLDEPTANLDIKNQMEVMNLIKSVAKEYNAIVIMTLHDLNLAINFNERFIVLKEGRILADVRREKLTNEVINEAFNINAEIIKIDNQYFIKYKK